MLKFSKYNILLTIRRLLGVLIILMGGYLAALFCIKFIFYILYAGTEMIDEFFKFLVRWGDEIERLLLSYLRKRI